MKTRLLMGLFFLFLTPSSFGASIGVSPSELGWNSMDWKELIVYNPSDEPVKFEVYSKNPVFEFSQSQATVNPKGSFKILVRPISNEIDDRIYLSLATSEDQAAAVAVKTSLKKMAVPPITGSLVGVSSLVPAGIALIVIIATVLMYIAVRQI